MDRKYILLNGTEEVEISRAAAFALESSEYIVPVAPSSQAIWCFSPAKGRSWHEIMSALKDAGFNRK